MPSLVSVNQPPSTADSVGKTAPEEDRRDNIQLHGEPKLTP
jgi:hypothetical protein